MGSTSRQLKRTKPIINSFHSPLYLQHMLLLPLNWSSLFLNNSSSCQLISFSPSSLTSPSLPFLLWYRTYLPELLVKCFIILRNISRSLADSKPLISFNNGDIDKILNAPMKISSLLIYSLLLSLLDIYTSPMLLGREADKNRKGKRIRAWVIHQNNKIVRDGIGIEKRGRFHL